MTYSHEVERMCTVAKGVHHGPAPIPEEGEWVKAYEVKDISGLTHGVGWCAPQQGACKLTLNIKNGIIEEALVGPLFVIGKQAGSAYVDHQTSPMAKSASFKDSAIPTPQCCG